MNSIGTIILVLGIGIASTFVAGGLAAINPPEYDERQRIISGKAYQRSFFTLVIYQAAYLFLELKTGELPLEKPLGQLFGLFLAAAVFSVYRVRFDAFFTRRQHPGLWMWATGSIALIATAASVYLCHVVGFVREGKVTLASLIPIMGAFYLTLWIAIVCKLLRERRGEDGA